MKKKLLSAALGLVSTFAVSAAVQAATVTITCGAVGAAYDTCKRHANAWADMTGNKVNFFQAPESTTDGLALYQQYLGAGSDEIDVYSIDVIWPGIIAKHLLDLNKYIPKEHSMKHFPAIIDNNSSGKGELLAIPYYTDAGLLYYRSDLLEKHGHTAPQTWVELKKIAEDIVAKEKAANPKMVGFVFQANSYEGLTCDALEWIDSYGGGTIVDSKTGEVTINNPNAIRALEMAASWIGGIAPEGVLTYQEEDARGVFQSGNAIFMRNWPYAWSLGQADGSPIKDKIGVVPLPKGDTPESKNTGTLGGWNLAVSKYSKAPAEAASLVAYMTTSTMQFSRAIELSHLPTIGEVYKIPRLAEINPFQVKLLDTFNNAVARPSKFTGRKYNQVSTKFWNAVHSVLEGKMSAADALARLEKDLNRIKGRGW